MYMAKLYYSKLKNIEVNEMNQYNEISTLQYMESKTRIISHIFESMLVYFYRNICIV